MKKLTRKYQVTVFYLSVFMFGWIPIYLITGSPAYSAPIPLVMAIRMKWYLEGRKGLREIATTCFSVRIPLNIWVIALVGPLV